MYSDYDPKSAQATILVVEDEAFIRLDVVEHLRSDGFFVFEAANADQAIAILRSQANIRILFTDVDMPGSMNGLKLAAAVRDRWPPVKIIVTSGHRIVVAGDMPEGSVFFSKPYSEGAVIASIRHMLA
jgi:CheY-like chemotaxis protein